MKDIILKTHNLSKNYGDQKSLNNVSMTVEKGQIYGFIGKNGAGKTTLMKLVTGLIHRSSGEIERRKKEEIQEFFIRYEATFRNCKCITWKF